MEFSFLYAIPRTIQLDRFFLVLTGIAGSYGQLWLVAAALLLVFRKTRKTGAAVIISYLAVFLIGQLVLKSLVSRPRPCQIDRAFALLVSRPSSSSFPSTHSAWAFAAATVLFMMHGKMGALAYIAAALIAFSRLYLFVHFPTDVLFGMVMGIVLGILAVKLTRYIWDKFSRAGSRTGN